MIRSSLGTGLLFGAFGILASGILAFFSHRVVKPSGALGAVAAVSGFIAIEVDNRFIDLVPVAVWVAVGLLCAGGYAQERWPYAGGLIGFLPGSAVLALAPMPGLSIGIRVVLCVATWLGSVAAHDFEQAHASDGFLLWLLPISAFVPALIVEGGTETGWVLVGAMLPLIVNVVFGVKARIGPAGAAPLVALYMWVGVSVAGNQGTRVSAVIGGLGLILCEPVARTLAALERNRRTKRPKKIDESSPVVIAAAVLGQASVALYALVFTSRTEQVEYAILALLPALIAATVFARALVPSPSRRRSEVRSKTKRMSELKRSAEAFRVRARANNHAGIDSRYRRRK